MAIWNLGSINADYFYNVPQLPSPGETLAATTRESFLGGKGTNMSVASARAGATVHHIGAVGAEAHRAVHVLVTEGLGRIVVPRIAVHADLEVRQREARRGQGTHRRA